jgi:hypothetical protein
VSVALPAHIYIDRCTTLRDAMIRCASPRDSLHELFTIVQNLTKQLQTQHRRSICLRDINTRNIVCANVGTSKSWTLLEYCSTQRSGTKVDHLPARCCPPEVCASSMCGSRTFSFFPQGILCCVDDQAAPVLESICLQDINSVLVRRELQCKDINTRNKQLLFVESDH